MTSNTDGAAQGEWHEGFQPNGHRGDFKFICECTDGYHTGMVTNDRIIADHRKAQMADVLAKALEIIANELTHDPGYAQLARDVAESTARAALTQFHAATEAAR